MKILILEDDSYRATTFLEKFCSHDVVITENSGVAIEYLEEEVFDLIFLDHDLGENNGCGADVAAFLAYNQENPNSNAQIIIHSWNTVAAKAMLNILPQARFIPFGNDTFFMLDS